MKKLLILILVSFSSLTELFEEHYEEAEKIMKNMTIEQKIGQLFFPRFNNKTKEKDIKEKFPGGFVLFAIDFNEQEDIVINNMDYIQKLSNDILGLPLGLSVDEEGGTVNRISLYHRESPFPSPQEIYDEHGIDGILTIDKEKRDLLRKFKMNINLAPVADISYNSSDYIYDRTLGRLPEETADYIEADVNGYVNDNFSCCNKHFPGYGNNTNTHTGIAIDPRPYETFLHEDFLTFKAGIEQKIPMILVSHNIVLCKDKKHPASISETWHDILRNELGFSGLILTDDLSMDAIKEYTDNYSPAIIAVNAGNDILLTSDYYEHLQAVIDAVKNGTIPEDKIFKACRRIIAWKIHYLGARAKDEGTDEGSSTDSTHTEQKDDDDDGDNNTTLIIILCVVGVIVLSVIVFVLLKFVFCKKAKVTSGLTEVVENSDKFLQNQ